MHICTAQTTHLDLIHGTPELARAEARGAAEGDFSELCTLLGVPLATEWPPELFDDDARQWFLQHIEAEPANAAWYCPWFPLLRTACGTVLVGCGGFKGPRDAEGTVEIGYSILPAHWRRGYATELVEGLCRWGFAQPGVRRIIAHTLPELTGSIRVLEKNGFVQVAGGEPGEIRFQKMSGGRA